MTLPPLFPDRLRDMTTMTTPGLLPKMPFPQFVYRLANWDGYEERFAEDFCLLAALEYTLARVAIEERNAYLSVGDLRPQILELVVEKTREVFPDFELPGTDEEPIIDRLDMRFAPLQRHDLDETVDEREARWAALGRAMANASRVVAEELPNPNALDREVLGALGWTLPESDDE
jgi:hypothetical protein